MIDVMHLINLFGKRHNIKDEVKIHMVGDTLQITEEIHVDCFNFIFM